MKIEMADYGPVLVTRGPDKGKTGYYDDDEDRWAFVYFGVPFVGQPQRIARSWLVRADDHPPLTRWVKRHPELAKNIGVMAKRP